MQRYTNFYPLPGLLLDIYGVRHLIRVHHSFRRKYFFRSISWNATKKFHLTGSIKGLRFSTWNIKILGSINPGAAVIKTFQFHSGGAVSAPYQSRKLIKVTSTIFLYSRFTAVIKPKNCSHHTVYCFQWENHKNQVYFERFHPEMPLKPIFLHCLRLLVIPH